MVAAGQQVAIEAPGRRFGVGRKFSGEALTEPVERREGLVAPTAGGQRRHQQAVRALMEGVGRRHRAGDLGDLGVLAPLRQHLGVLDQQTQAAFTQRIPGGLGPGLELILGQQVATVQLVGRPVVAGRTRLARTPAGGPERLHVEPGHHAVGQQHDVIAQGEKNAGSGGEHAAGHVQRLVQVVDPGRRIAIGPEQGHQRFAVHPMPVSEDQELDQCPGLTQAPGVGRHQAAAHGRLEPTEETDAHARVASHCLDLPAAAASFARRYPQPPRTASGQRPPDANAPGRSRLRRR